MTAEEIKKKIKEQKIDRRKIARRLNISCSYLNGILNGWNAMKEEHRIMIEQEFEHID
jgi:transcriptional regulator with XRE-family HTH domain